MFIVPFGSKDLVMRALTKRLNGQSATLLWFMGAILFGRVTGLVREVVLGNLFGATRAADVIIIALAVPDVLANALLVSGFSAVFVPYLLSYSPNLRSREFWRVSALIVVISILLMVCLVSLTDHVMLLFAPGLAPFGSDELFAFRWILASFPLTILSGLMIAWLASKKSFVFGGVGTAIINVAVIIGLLIGYFSGDAIRWVVTGLILGLSVRLLVYIFISHRFQLVMGFYGLSTDLKLIGRVILVATAMSALTLAPLLFRAIVSMEGEGMLTLFSMSLKLIELPLTVVFWSIGFVALPELSTLYRKSAQNATDRLEDNLIRASKIGVAAFLCVGGLSDHLVGLAFGWGAFTEPQLKLMSDAVAIGAVGFPVMGVTTLLLNDHFALKRYRAVFSVVVASLSIVGAVAWMVMADYSLQEMFMIWTALYGIIATGLWTSRSTAGLPKIRIRRVALLWVLGYIATIYLVLWGVADIFVGAWGADVLYGLCACAVAYKAIVKSVLRI